mgnify:CR=1 FL=1
MLSTFEQTTKILLTLREAAEALGISERTLWSMTAPRGPVPVVRIGGRAVRYRVEALEQFARDQEVATV